MTSAATDTGERLPSPGTDLLCVAPHTDDAEIALGGTLRLLSARGRTVRVCDLTGGELASNGTPDERWAEAAVASAELGLAQRVQLALPDGFLDPASPRQVAPLVTILRRWRPRWVVTAPAPRRHPDHVAAPALVARACFLARLATYQPASGGERWWPVGPQQDESLQPVAKTWIAEALLEVCPEDGVPSLIFDVTTTWDAKLRAIACYGSQFVRGGDRRPTFINSEDFLRRLEGRGRLWGARAGVAYGEALRTRAVPVLADLPPEVWT
ncbi:MAG: bacillithiol biosynthesis deacetylase BshB1 [Candidatus Krumholzibacteriia bacterium]